MKKKFNLLLIILVLLSVNHSFCQITILSGPENGSYHHFAEDMVKVLGEKEGIEIVNTTTDGSAENFNQLIDSEAEAQIAFIQSDYFSLKTAEDLINDTQITSSLKVFMPMAKEQMHIFTKRSNGLTKIEDLNNKRLGVGTENQSTFYTAEIIQKRSGINWFANKLDYKEMIKKITSINIEAGFIIGSAPLQFLDIDPQIMVDELVLLELTDYNGWAEEYEPDVISADDYEWLDKDVPTFSLRTLLVVNMDKISETDKKTLESIKAGIATNIEYLKEVGHPNWDTVKIPTAN